MRRASACCPTSTRPRPRPTSMRAFPRTSSPAIDTSGCVPTLQSLSQRLRRDPGVRGFDLRQLHRGRRRRSGFRRHRPRRGPRRVLRPGSLRWTRRSIRRTAGARSSSSIPTRPMERARPMRRGRSTRRPCCVHPLTTGITSLTSAKFAGGNKAKPGTTVVAYWIQPNAQGSADPAISYPQDQRRVRDPCSPSRPTMPSSALRARTSAAISIARGRTPSTSAPTAAPWPSATIPAAFPRTCRRCRSGAWR